MKRKNKSLSLFIKSPWLFVAKRYPLHEFYAALAQAFEDTGVRAYKGKAANLITTPDLLTAALQIHSVEAKHASEVRRLRGLKGWISNDERGAGMPEATQAVYPGEGVTVQAGYNTSTLFGAAAGSEAYDEPQLIKAVEDRSQKSKTFEAL